MSKKTLKIITFLVCIIFISYIYNNLFTSNMLVGSYKLVIKEGSYMYNQHPNEIFLAADGTFTASEGAFIVSDTKISGVYEVSSSLKEGTKIDIRPIEGGNKFMPVYSVSINRGWYGCLKIILDGHFGIYYIKTSYLPFF
jgi:hypothetical protein